jgi:5-methyltetrahydropteroyltriglutamate--homocysteine methyltransferase
VAIAVKALEIVVSGLSSGTTTISHVCYGDFTTIYPAILDLPVDMLDLELANSHYDMLAHFRKHPFTKKIGYGLLDVHSHVIESVDQVREGLLNGLEVLTPEQIYPTPDCGLKTRTLDESWAKLRVLVQATRDVKSAVGVA